MRHEMHVHDRRHRTQQMLVEGGDFVAAVRQALHHRADLRLGQHEIAGREHAAVRHRIECGERAQREGGIETDSIQAHREVGTGKIDAVGAAGQHRPRLPDRLRHAGPVGKRGVRRSSHGQAHGGRENLRMSQHRLLPWQG
jgi:hypothetical protein